ncbi:MAG: Tat pathway signal protein [Bacteroidota bacterium]
MKRRKFITLAGIGTVAIGGAAYFIDSNYQMGQYERQVATTWSHSAKFTGSNQWVMKELVRYATLAANSHNTQPWLFKIGSRSITISPDFNRRCPVVDPDDHHLYASLGCATENIVHASKAFGLKANVSVQHNSNEVIEIIFEPMAINKTELFHAIPKRQCTKVTYDGKKVASEELKLLEMAAQVEGISTQLFTDHNNMETILEYLVEGNMAQMRDKAFISELKDWMRYNPSSALKFGDGLFSATTGNPTAPNWLGDLIFAMAFTEKGENDKYMEQMRSSAGVIAFISEQDNVEHWIKAGRSYQRFALQATALGLKHAFINQPVEVPEVRAQFADYLNIGDRRTDLLVRFGYGPTMIKTMRRPLDQVMV